MRAFMSTKILRYFSHVHPAMISALLSSHDVDAILGSKPRLSVAYNPLVFGFCLVLTHSYD